MPKQRSDYGRDSSQDDYDDEWGYYPPSSPLPAHGIQSKSKQGTFAESWWAKRWIKILEGYGIGNRLQRGRSYARSGQVLEINILLGRVMARVQGSQHTPYKVRIALPMLTDAEWRRVIEAMSAKAIFAARLLAGDMPNEIEEAFKAANTSLFPVYGDELESDCSCPDAANPCKHIAAVYYLLGEQFDADPFLIFTLRGRTRDQVIAALRQRRAAAIREDQPAFALALEYAPALTDQLATFWQMGDLPASPPHIAAPALQAAVLRRLGAAPAGIEGALDAIYSMMTPFALRKVFEDNAGNEKSPVEN